MSPTNYFDIIQKFSSAKVLCIGDVMLDSFNHGTVDRISPERPVPVFRPGQIVHVPGGAANVAINIVSLGAYCTLIGYIGNDETGSILKSLFDNSRLTEHLIIVEDYVTTHKLRLTAAAQHLLRLDVENQNTITTRAQSSIIALAESLIFSHDILIISDYAKGLFVPSLLSSLIAMAADHNVPVIVDPKGADSVRYLGATIITPNANEAEVFTGIKIRSDCDAEEAGKRLLSQDNFNAVLITRGSGGMTLCCSGEKPKHFPTCAVDVFDVVGAGDTVVAGLACALAAGSSLSDAATIANTASGIVVGKRDTSTVSSSELIHRFATINKPLIPAQKLFPFPFNDLDVINWINIHRESGRRIGFTNGVFDVIHSGHVSLLQFASESCDILIVGLNSDSSVHLLNKAPNRPINTTIARRCVISAFSTVDAVTVFDDETPLRLIQLIRPDVLIKGADYSLEHVIGADFVRSYGGQVLLAPIIPGFSSTKLYAPPSFTRNSDPPASSFSRS
jgi:D-beta-D-heptose 7-phosphate kinase / D-beta-D-heptose 1-phosphate adenosyltransferase